MAEAHGVITDILGHINYCEFCDAPAGNDVALEIYTIDKFDTVHPEDLYRNIIVLCPGCKKNYDDNVFGKKHLKACVMLRDPELSHWLEDLFGQYSFRGKPGPAKRGLMSRLDRLVGDQRYLNNAVFIFGIFLIAVGVLLFSYGYSNVYSYNNGLAVGGDLMTSQDYTFSLFLEMAGVICALLGLFFELGLVKGPVKVGFK